MTTITLIDGGCHLDFQYPRKCIYINIKIKDIDESKLCLTDARYILQDGEIEYNSKHQT